MSSYLSVIDLSVIDLSVIDLCVIDLSEIKRSFLILRKKMTFDFFLRLLHNTYKSIALSFFSHVIVGLFISAPSPYAPQNRIAFDPNMANVSRGRSVKLGWIPRKPSSITRNQKRNQN